MFCYNCGAAILQGNEFCVKCGTRQTDAPAQTQSQPTAAPQEYNPTVPVYNSEPQTVPVSQVQTNYNAQNTYTQPQTPYVSQQPAYQTNNGQQGYYPQQGYAAPAAKPKKKMFLKVGAPVAAVLVLALTLTYFLVFRSPENIIARALAGVGAETMQRIDNSPLSAFAILADTMQDGTMTVDFDYEDYWGDRTRGNISLASDSDKMEYALYGYVDTYYSGKIDFEAFMNKDRLAIGSQQIGSDYYGITYKTFEDDIDVFGNKVGLDRGTKDVLIELVNSLDTAFNGDSYLNGNYDYDEYMKALSTLMTKSEQSTESTDITVSGSTIGVTKTSYAITKDAIMATLDELYITLDNDDTLRDVVNAVDTIDPYSYGSSYGNFLREFRDMIDEFDRYYSDSSIITVSFYIGSGDRLIWLEVEGDVRFDGDWSDFYFKADFGTSATDTWEFTFGDRYDTLSVLWEYKERGNTVENVIAINDGYDRYELGCEWDTVGGDFSFFYYDGYTKSSFGGNYIKTNDGFKLSFDERMEAYYGEERIRIDITVSRGANIKKIDYINIDKWTEDLFYNLGDFLY